MNEQAQKNRMTQEAYLEFERNSDIKHEYFDGEIFTMVGAKKNHVLIGANITAELVSKFAADNSTCRVLPNDMRVKIQSNIGYAYPDIAVACGDIEFEDNNFDTLMNPIVIFEILSMSTEAFDSAPAGAMPGTKLTSNSNELLRRGDKFACYRRIPSLQEYILVSQKRHRIERFVRKDDGSWSMFLYEDIEQEVKIETIDCEVPLSVIYRWIEFDDADI
jgi:Uma2 family endonuclease